MASLITALWRHGSQRWRHASQRYDVINHGVLTSLITALWRHQSQRYDVIDFGVMTSSITILWRHASWRYDISGYVWCRHWFRISYRILLLAFGVTVLLRMMLFSFKNNFDRKNSLWFSSFSSNSAAFYWLLWRFHQLTEDTANKHTSIPRQTNWSRLLQRSTVKWFQFPQRSNTAGFSIHSRSRGSGRISWVENQKS